VDAVGLLVGEDVIVPVQEEVGVGALHAVGDGGLLARARVGVTATGANRRRASLSGYAGDI